MDFSSNSKQLALGFAGGSVGLVALLTFKGGQTRWDIVGQQTAHPAPASLVGLTFGEAPSGVTKLFSLGKVTLTLMMKTKILITIVTAILRNITVTIILLKTMIGIMMLCQSSTAVIAKCMWLHVLCVFVVLYEECLCSQGQHSRRV